MARVGFEPRPFDHQPGALTTRPRCRILKQFNFVFISAFCLVIGHLNLNSASSRESVDVGE